VNTEASATPWAQGRLDARAGQGQILFGRMYEDSAIEAAVFAAGARVFCIASAGCTAMALAGTREVVAVDINPVQLDYAARRIAGHAAIPGAAEQVMAAGRVLAPLLGWTASRLGAFLSFNDVAAQTGFWHRHLDTARFRGAMDGLFSLVSLRTAYSSALLECLPPRLGQVMRARMARCFSRHANAANPFASALLAGAMPPPAPRAAAVPIRLVHADAAEYLESEPKGGFDGFALSNILDGTSRAYADRLCAAVRRAAAPGAVRVLRSFREPTSSCNDNRAAADRSMLWGIVDVGAAATLTPPWSNP
jgi:S-adenosylmethionine:diacylglycerol 3-amino-3-carboxypropyl transferase